MLWTLSNLPCKADKLSSRQKLVKIRHLCGRLHGQEISVKPQLLLPDVAGHGTEDAHRQLQDDDKPNLEVEKVVVGACTKLFILVCIPYLSVYFRLHT